MIRKKVLGFDDAGLPIVKHKNRYYILKNEVSIVVDGEFYWLNNCRIEIGKTYTFTGFDPDGDVGFYIGLSKKEIAQLYKLIK